MPSPLACPSTRRRSILQLCLSAGLGLAGCGGGADDSEPSTTKASLQRAANAAVSAGLVGLLLGEVTNESSALAVAGKRRQATGSAVRRTDAFAIGSNTKAMTCAAVAAMVERGWLSWDLTLQQAFPEWAGEMNAAYATVTLKDLLHHRGAVLAFNGAGPEEEAFLASVSADSSTLPGDRSRDHRRVFARWLLAQAPVAGLTPGRDFHYSNAGYALAAATVEAQTGRAFEALFDEVLLQPLQLAGQWRSPVPTGTDVVWGHEGLAGALTVVESTPELVAVKGWLDVLGPAGHWACTGEAYAHWLRWHTLALRGASTPLPETYVNDLRAASGNRYVWGWQSLTTANRVLLTHTGHVPGFMAEVILDTQGDRALFGVSNTGFMGEGATSWVLTLIDDALAEVLRAQSQAA